MTRRSRTSLTFRFRSLMSRAKKAAGNTLIYLAISPDFFGEVHQRLDAAGFTRMQGLKRIIVEKPFGNDLDSAIHLTRELLGYVCMEPCDGPS